MIRAVLFDCDGVLLDTEPVGCACLAEAVTAAGLPMTQVEAAAMFSGSAARESMAKMAALGLDGAKVFPDSDRRLFKRFEEDVPEIDGIFDLLSGCDLPVAVCSNSSLLRLSLSLERTRLAAFFGPHIYSSDHVADPKPAPDMALHACAALGIAPHEAVFIDDNVHGVACAAAAGCIAVGFIGPSEHRAGHAETLRAAGAHHIVHGMPAFAALIAQLSRPQAVAAQ